MAFARKYSTTLILSGSSIFCLIQSLIVCFIVDFACSWRSLGSMRPPWSFRGVPFLPDFAETGVLVRQRWALMATVGFLALIGLFMSCFCSGLFYALIGFCSLTTKIGQKMKLPERTGVRTFPHSLRGICDQVNHNSTVFYDT